MAKEQLVTEFRALAKVLEEAAGPLALLMILPSAPGAEDAWTLLVSARTLDDKPQRESINTIAAHLNRALSDDVRPWVKKISILKSEDPFVRAMNSTIRAEHSTVDLRSTVVGGIEISRAIVFESKRMAA